MQDQEFITDQSSENIENQEPVSAAHETETLSGFNPGAEQIEQETVVFSQPAENFADAPTVQAVSPDEDELFGKYEIKNWDFTPRIYKIFAASAILNILFLLTVAQTNVLRTKACDSPLVAGFCQVLDAVYLGSKILGTDDEFVSKPYEKTELEDAEIVWLDQTGIEPPLTYPAGYFQIANPEMFPAEDPLANPDNSGFPSVVNQAPPMSANPTSPNPIMPSVTDNSGVMNRRQRLPKTNKNAIPNDLPTGINVTPTEDNTADSKNPKDSTKENVADNKEKSDSKQPAITSDPLKKVEINRKPFDDFGVEVNAKVANESLDLTKPFEIVMVGTIRKDGKIDTAPDKSRIIKQIGDEKMLAVAKEAVEAIGESGILGYLSELDVEKVTLQLIQTDNSIKVVIASDQKTPNNAKSKASSLNIIIEGAKFLAKTDDEKALLNGAKVTSDKKNFIINFDLSKEIAHPMIKRALEKAEAKRKAAEQNKPNSTAQTVNNNVNTSK
ncbi:MAG: hypothetical protein ACR2F2_06425 [Pyrinomonadaceae bacterium]